MSYSVNECGKSRHATEPTIANYRQYGYNNLTVIVSVTETNYFTEMFVS